MSAGMDSLTVTAFTNAIAAQLSIEALATLVFDHPTLDAIAAHLEVAAPRTQRPATAVVERKSTSGPKPSILRGRVRLAGTAGTLTRLRGLICSSTVAPSSIPAARWEDEADSTQPSAGYGSFVGQECFDAAAFGVGLPEGRVLQLQQVLLLNVGLVTVFSDRGLARTDVGVFVGVEPSDAETATLSVFSAAGSAVSVVSGRVSYVLGLVGPSISVDTACSSALVAAHQAAAALDRAECGEAITAATKALGQRSNRATAVGGMTSARGRCHSFDDRADGYCRGEGCVALLLSSASTAGMPRLLATAVQHDGPSASLTAPNGQSQARLLRTVQGASARTLESHGTGTALGDPVEIGAALVALDADTLCSSVKASMGHLEACAAAAGLASVLSIGASLVAANVQLLRLNAHLRALGLDDRLVLPAGIVSCDAVGHRLSSFGFSGTIAHGVLASPRAAASSVFAEEFASIFRSETLRAATMSTSLRLQLEPPATKVAELAPAVRVMTSSHVIGDKALFPGVGFVEMALANAQTRSASLTSMAFTRPLVLGSSRGTMRYARTSRGEYTISSETHVHAMGTEAELPIKSLSSPQSLGKSPTVVRLVAAALVAVSDHRIHAPASTCAPRHETSRCLTTRSTSTSGRHLCLASRVGRRSENLKPAPQCVKLRWLLLAKLAQHDLTRVLARVRVELPSIPTTLALSFRGRASTETKAIRSRRSTMARGRVSETETIQTAVLELLATEVTKEAPLMAGGLDSLGATELVRVVRTRCSVELSPTTLFDHPTVESLAKHVASLLAVDATDDDQQPEEDVAAETDSELVLEITSTAALLPVRDRSCAAGDLWGLSQDGCVTCGSVPLARWDADRVETRQFSSDVVARAGYGSFLSAELSWFDGAFFRMKPAEAVPLEPQQRMLLEVGYEAVHRGGSRRASLGESNVGSFTGMMNMDAASQLPAEPGPYDLTGVGYSAAGARLSYAFAMRGPCVVVDTACSSSLIAVHLARRSLQHGECSGAVVAGPNAILAPAAHVGPALAGMTSARGRCHTMDSRADGYARGEGCGAISMKPGRCDSTIRFRGSSARHNGRSASFTALNGASQQLLLRRASSDASCRAESTGVVEAHGTGTALGDPIEMSAIAAVASSKKSALSVVAVKANVGHTESTAGVAGVLRIVELITRTAWVANAQLRRLNSQVGSVRGEDVVFVGTDAAGTVGVERLGGVSSFGWSGIIAHGVCFSSLE